MAKQGKQKRARNNKEAEGDSFLGFDEADVEEVELEEVFEDKLEKQQDVGTNLPALVIHTPVANKQSMLPVAPVDAVMNCDYCYLQERCSGYKKGGKCTFDYAPIKISSADDIPNTMLAMKVKLFEVQSERVMRAIHHEKTDGGVVDKTVSEEMDRLNDFMNDVKEYCMPSENEGINISAKGSSAKGIIERIFG